MELARSRIEWTSDIAEELFSVLAKDARNLAYKMGLAFDSVEASVSATELVHPSTLLPPRDAEEYARRVHEYEEAVKPIREHMVRLYDQFTRPIYFIPLTTRAER